MHTDHKTKAGFHKSLQEEQELLRSLRNSCPFGKKKRLGLNMKTCSNLDDWGKSHVDMSMIVDVNLQNSTCVAISWPCWVSLFLAPQHCFDEMRLRHLADVDRSDSAEDFTERSQLRWLISFAFVRNLYDFYE